MAIGIIRATGANHTLARLGKETTLFSRRKGVAREHPYNGRQEEMP
jgi:hypothetical protein